MTETAKLSLPLLAPSQAQKHVTVNEALGRLDAAVQLSVLSRAAAVPPAAAQDGDTHLVAPGGVNDWSGQDGRIAVRQNGGWVFLLPAAGWRAFVVDESVTLLHDGADWVEGAAAVSLGGAALAFGVHEFDHALSAGATSLTTPELPANAAVFGVTGRLLSDITGSLSSWRLGVLGSDDRYGSGIGTFEGSWLRGLTGTPLTYYAPTELLLTAEGGTFDGGGSVRLAVHYATIGLPRPL
ncbi:MAG: DUF2793 domain-containing protein, partial [Paracoccaceae bacterium]|nr:DUF2793 domain-containing protein [Paracoccaceae bacterium]